MYYCSQCSKLSVRDGANDESSHLNPVQLVPPQLEEFRSLQGARTRAAVYRILTDDPSTLSAGGYLRMRQYRQGSSQPHDEEAVEEQQRGEQVGAAIIRHHRVSTAIHYVPPSQHISNQLKDRKLNHSPQLI